MKKVISLMLIVVMCISLVACGGESKSTNNSASENSANENLTTDNSENKEENIEKSEEKIKKIDKNIDAVAAELGLSGGEENMYAKIGATYGKEYNNGNVVLYQYDVNSEKYQNILNGNGSSRIAAYKDGIVLLFPVGSTPDANLINIFNELSFN